jgi:hypothetical protein
MNIIFEEHDREFARICLRDLSKELDVIGQVIDVRKIRAQLLHTFKLIDDGNAYGSRMSLFHVQNNLSLISGQLGNSTGNIKTLRAVLRAWECVSNAGRPMGHALDKNGATPYKVGGIL